MNKQNKKEYKNEQKKNYCHICIDAHDACNGHHGNG